VWDWGHAALLQSTGTSFLAQSCAPDHGVHRGDADDGSGDDWARSCVTFLYGPRACLSPSTEALAAACKYFGSFRVPGYQWRLVRARASGTNGVSSVCARAVCSIVVAIILTPVLVLVFFLSSPYLAYPRCTAPSLDVFLHSCRRHGGHG